MANTTSRTPRDLNPLTMLECARHFIHGDPASSDGLWPRAAASLARQALEGLVAELWRRDPALAPLSDCRARTQLICLRAIFDPDVAREATATWAVLSRACHYHAYELPPTAAELDSCIDVVERLMVEVAAATAGG